LTGEWLCTAVLTAASSLIWRELLEWTYFLLRSFGGDDQSLGEEQIESVASSFSFY